jgi:cytoskeletal protein RodZ
MAEEEKTEEETSKEAPKESEKKKSPTTPIIIILAVVIGLGLIYFAGTRLLGFTTRRATEEAVEESIEKATEGEAKVDIADEGGEITVETEEGTFTTGKKELPDNFPSDLPVYSNAEIITTASSENSVAVSWSTEDSQEKVSEFYKDELTDSAWKITQTATLGNATVYGVEKGNMSGAVAVSETEEGTTITITLELATE